MKARAYGGMLSISLALNLNAAQNSVYIPTFAQLKANYPLDPNTGLQVSPPEAYRLAGDPLYTDKFLANPAKFWNACAVRLSLAFNMSGFKLSAGDYNGANGLKYFTSSVRMFEHLKQIPGVIVSEGTEDFSKLANEIGIYFFKPNDPEKFQAYGHIDLIENGQCVSGHCYEGAEGTFYLITFDTW